MSRNSPSQNHDHTNREEKELLLFKFKIKALHLFSATLLSTKSIRGPWNTREIHGKNHRRKLSPALLNYIYMRD